MVAGTNRLTGNEKMDGNEKCWSLVIPYFLYIFFSSGRDNFRSHKSYNSA